MEKILIVDDDPNICEVVKLYLNNEGYKTTIAYDGKSAIDSFREQKPDLIILDIMLPIRNGYEVLKEIRKESDIPIIMLTAKDDVIDKVVGFEIGADDYVVKPFEPRELVARVKAAIRRAALIKSSIDNKDKDEKILSYPDLVINLSSYLVSYYDKEIELSPKEIELLFFLASHPNKVFTREYLLEKIWDYNYPGNSRTVDEHIKRLRKKIPDHKDWAITTVWGVGYKFEVKI
jgi:DNA-binding response OmpR family regulator